MKKFYSIFTILIGSLFLFVQSETSFAKKRTYYSKSYKKGKIRYKKRSYRKIGSRSRLRRSKKRSRKFSRVRRTGRSSTLSILRRVKPRGLPLNLAKAVITIESRWNPNARGAAGEKGLMQLMPATSRAWGGRNSFNVTLNLRAGTKYLYWCYRRARTNIRKTISCYNAGPGRMNTGHRIASTRRYISRVQRMVGRK